MSVQLSQTTRPPMFSSFVALSPEQEEALDFARMLEERVATMAAFAPGKIALSVAAKNLRDYVAATI
jgi:hypothetical protein